MRVEAWQIMQIKGKRFHRRGWRVVSWLGALGASLSGRDNYGAFVCENKPYATIALLIGRFRLGNWKFRFSRRRAARIRTRPIISLSRIHRGCPEIRKIARDSASYSRTQPRLHSTNSIAFELVPLPNFQLRHIIVSIPASWNVRCPGVDWCAAICVIARCSIKCATFGNSVQMCCRVERTGIFCNLLSVFRVQWFEAERVTGIGQILRLFRANNLCTIDKCATLFQRVALNSELN